MRAFRVKVEINGKSSGGTNAAGEIFNEVSTRMKDLSAVTRTLPQMMRFGAGSLDEQIRQRSHFSRSGGQIPWQEPTHASGGPQDMVPLLEDVMWQSVRGGPGSITRSTPLTASVGVNDASIRARSAALGNQVVAHTPYFGFVTGNFQERTSAEKAIASKSTKTGKGAFPRNKAMYWFLLLQFGYKATAEELSSGLSVPPKNMGINPVMVDRVRRVVRNYIYTGQVSGNN